MRIEDIREQLLSMYSRHDSLFLTKHRKSRSEYYYNFNNTYEINELLLLTDSISNQMTINELSIDFYSDKDVVANTADILIKLKEYNNNVVLKFYYLDKIIIKRHNGIFSSKLKESKSFFNIEIDLEKNSFNWINDKLTVRKPLTFNYYLNKLIFSNVSFRKVFVCLLNLLSNEYCIYKDLIHDISNDQFCLLPLNIEQYKQFHNKKELINYLYSNNLRINYNKHSINSSYYKAIISQYTSEDDCNMLIQYDDYRLINSVDIHDLYNGVGIHSFLFHHYKNSFDIDNEDLRSILEDYINMSIANNEPISLDIENMQNLIIQHYCAMNRYLRKQDQFELSKYLICDSSKYNKLRKLLPNTFIWITTTKRLKEESINQHNCVYSYKDRISNDLCTIYHYEIEDRKYTIEFSIDFKGKYYIKQMKQKYNKTFNVSDYEYVNSLLRGGQDDLFSS